MNKINTPQFFFAIVLMFFVVSCTKKSVDPDENTGVPEDLNDGWDVSAPLLQGVNIDTLEALSQAFEGGDFGDVHSFLIVRNGRLIFERYYQTFNPVVVQRIYSVTKSITSALIGIAIEKGYINSLDQLISEFFPQYADIINTDPRKQSLTIRHLLTMTAGLEYDEFSYPFNDWRNTWVQMHASDDWLRFVLELPSVNDPGTTFAYNSGLTLLLGGILHAVTGQHADELADEWLFEPLETTSRMWNYEHGNSDGLPDTGGGLWLNLRNMAKFGQMYLDNGVWDGVQIVPAEWVEESVSQIVDLGGSTYYGYQWWSFRYTQIPEPGVEIERYVPFAMGYGGQFVFVIPAINAVFCMTADNGLDGIDVWRLFSEYIFPSIM